MSAISAAIPIFKIRDTFVMLDSDLAQLYGVETRALNQAIQRSKDRFPSDFAFPIDPKELTILKSQIVTSSSPRKYTWMTPAHGGRRTPPLVFTEHGALMASTILNSTKAVKMSLYIIRAFVKMREELTSNQAILKRLAEIDKSLLIHDRALHDLYRKLLPLLSPPARPSKPPIGFSV